MAKRTLHSEVERASGALREVMGQVVELGLAVETDTAFDINVSTGDRPSVDER